MAAPALRAQENQFGPYHGVFVSEGYGLKKTLAKNNSVLKANADWTFNFWIKPEAPCLPKTLLAGFGSGDNRQGAERYLAIFADGLRFWGGSVDIVAKAQLVTGQWQMLTAVDDNQVLKIYKDGAELCTAPVVLADAAPEINLGRLSPWDDGGHFAGKIARFTLWNEALSPDKIQALTKDSAGLDALVYEKGLPPTWALQVPRPAGWKPGNPNQNPDTFPKSNAAFSAPTIGPQLSQIPITQDDNGGLLLSGAWKMAEAPKVTADGAVISQPGFNSESWCDAVVPGTALTTLVHAGVYPDPLFGLNNRAIPESLCHQDYWYRVEFNAPADFSGHAISLTFNGINYRAEVWLNGVREGEVLGAFIRGVFDVSKDIKSGKPNAIAVLVSPAPNPGIAHEQSIAAGAGPNGGAMCLDGPTFFCSEGWDWIPGIRDRNTGIWQSVVLHASGAVKISDPHVVTHLTDPMGVGAEVTLVADLKNNSEVEQRGVLRAQFEGVTVEKPVTIPAGATQTITLAPSEYPQLAVSHPRLWWPNGYGKPELYHLQLTFVGADGTVSDTDRLRFGIREISIELTAMDSEEKVGRYEFFPTVAGATEVVKHDHASLVNSVRSGWVPTLADGAGTSPALKMLPDDGVGRFLVVKINGRRIAIRGGNWGMDDAMKRVSRERLEPYIRLQHDANFNTLRNWCGQSTEEDLFDLCDEYGILVWNEFWLSTQNYNVEPSAAEPLLSNAADTIKRFRNHPSILLWCGRNEGVPPPEINEGLDRLIRQLDGTRYYQPDSTQFNMCGSGPWSYEDSARYFTDLSRGFTTELGLPSPLTADAIKAMMAPEDLWPFSDVWAYHDWIPRDAMDTRKYMAALDEELGPPTGLDDFVRKAQMVNYVTHRAMFEGMNASLWNPVSGRLMWMSHPSWPSMVWQIYSWDYEPNASFYGIKCACEPVHVQMNLPDYGVTISNTTVQALSRVKVTAEVYNLKGEMVSTKEEVVDVPADATATCSFKVEAVADKTVEFTRLQLHDAEGKILSENFYWEAPEKSDYLALVQLPQVQLAATGVHGEHDPADPARMTISLDLENTSKSIALMTFLTLRDATTGKRVLPAFASDNYVSFLPGQKRHVTFECPRITPGAPLEITVDGWNLVPQTLRVD